MFKKMEIKKPSGILYCPWYLWGGKAAGRLPRQVAGIDAAIISSQLLLYLFMAA